MPITTKILLPNRPSIVNFDTNDKIGKKFPLALKATGGRTVIAFRPRNRIEILGIFSRIVRRLVPMGRNAH